MKCPHCGIDKEELYKVLAEMSKRTQQRIELLESIREGKIKRLLEDRD